MAFDIFLTCLAAIAVFNAWATRAIFKDHFLTPIQRAAQTLLVWGVPLLGALLVVQILRNKTEPPSGRYPIEHEPPEDFGWLRPHAMTSSASAESSDTSPSDSTD